MSLGMLMNFVKALQSFETCLSLSNSLFVKLISSLKSPIILDNSFKVTSVAFFIADFDLISCELILHLNRFTKSFYFDIIIKQEKFTTLSQFLEKNPK